MRYQLKNNSLIPFKARYIRHNGRIYANPTDEQLQAAGVLEKAPDYDKPVEEREGYYYTVTPVAGNDGLWHKTVEYIPAPDGDTESEVDQNEGN